MDRDLGLDRLACEEDWDFLIIGGGATGLGTALDAASRGYRVVLAEKADFASGTSSRSTKLVHGGVRYLKQGNFSLVKGALWERGLLFKNAPHLVHPLSFIIPNYHWWEGPYFATGLKFYDWLAGDLGIRNTKRLNRDEALQELPPLNSKGLCGGIQYWDGQFDDARLAIDLASNIWKHDGLALNYLAAKELIKENGRITGALCEDSIHGRAFEIRAKNVINATGVFSDTLRRLDKPNTNSIIQASQGAHIVVSQELLPLKSALIVPKTTDGRVLFAIPWHNRVIIGTTDTPMKNIDSNPKPLSKEIGFIVENATNYLDISINSQDIKGAYAGLRPLVSLKSNGGSTAKISRDHHIEISDTGLITIAGGKWTTYRKMAEDVIDRAEQASGLDKRPCITESLPIESGFPKAEGPQLHPELPYTLEQIDYSLAHEMPQSIDDLLSRRTRCATLDAEAALSIADKVSDRMALRGLLKHEDQQSAIAEFRSQAKLAL